MTRPQIIRADSIDLQDHDAPSAKEHKRPPRLTTNGSLAPHQAEAIREVEEERAEEEARSPRVSWANGDGGSDLQQYAEDLAAGVADSLNGNKMQQQDALAIAQNGGVTVNAADDGDVDADGDEGLDDDMMDKISSSPSIEDGVYPPCAWPQRVDSLRESATQNSPSPSPATSEAASSPFLEIPEHPPLRVRDQQQSKATVDVSRSLRQDHHHHGEYTWIFDYAEDEDGLDAQSSPEAITKTDEKTTQDRIDDLGDQLRKQRDSGIDLKIEDFSLDHELSVTYGIEDGPVTLRSLPPTPNEPCEDSNDDDDGFSFTDDTRFIDSGWDGEYLRNLEDIDFEFVYALHTFVATVEGQANATKGDTMVLLDDSNSYWWLVRVVKDSSIGYLPAEHIETPTERLARLNKHRNIDLAATMLGDQTEKSKNPLKTAMRRRKAKTVTFTAPTYVDYSDFDDSSEEEGVEGEPSSQSQPAQQQDQQGRQQDKQQQQQTPAEQTSTETVEEDDESAKVQPLKPRSQKQVRLDTAKPEEAKESESAASEDPLRNSDDIFDAKSERTTKNGTVRNTDSFFRDETIETKKITLTPGLLRDDTEARGSGDSKELRQRPSFEKELALEKGKDDKRKKEKEKREKEKKPSALRSFFSRKDKKKSPEEDDDSSGKRSIDTSLESADRDSEEQRVIDTAPSPDRQTTPQRNPSKLQKQQPRTEPSPTRKPNLVVQPPGSDRTPPLASEVKTNNVANVPPATLRMVESDLPENQAKSSPKEEKIKSAVSKILPTSSEGRPPRVTKAKSRVELDDFDSSQEETETTPEPSRPAPQPAPSKMQPPEEKQLRPILPGSYPDSYLGTQPAFTPQVEPSDPLPTVEQEQDRASESPMQVSPVSSVGPPALVGDTSSQEDRSSSVSSESPELGPGPDTRSHRNQDSVTTTSTTAATPTWNDAKLRAFFDSGTEVRDLLTIVYDTSDVPPAGPDHPIAGTLFREEQAKLADITTRLDNMLMDWLARKQRTRRPN